MDKHVLPATVGLDKPITFGRVEPLHCSACHVSPPCLVPRLWDSFLLAQVPGDFLQILGFAGAKQPTEFVEI